MPTRILSFSQMCLEADPGMLQGSLRPWVYQFSNNRRFYQRNPVYDTIQITSDDGTNIVDDAGNKITSDNGASMPNTGGGFPFGKGRFDVDSF